MEAWKLCHQSREWIWKKLLNRKHQLYKSAVALPCVTLGDFVCDCEPVCICDLKFNAEHRSCVIIPMCVTPLRHCLDLWETESWAEVIRQIRLGRYQETGWLHCGRKNLGVKLCLFSFFNFVYLLSDINVWFFYTWLGFVALGYLHLSDYHIPYISSCVP